MKKIYRIISTILVVAMIASSLSVMAATNEVEQTEEVLGTSVETPAEPTPDEPNQDDTVPEIVDGVIQIDDEQELNKIGNDDSYPLDGEYILTADIIMTENFHPIGKEGASFTGTFDGDGHVIYDLTIEEEEDNIGLFGVVSEGAIIKNIGIKNGSVTSKGLKVGGLVGWAAEATIENCYFIGNVSGDVAVGGLVGASGDMGAFNTASTVKNCYQIGTVKGNNVVGGIEGVAASPGFSFSMENCYHVGEIICAESWCGGLIGYFYEFVDISYSFENSYYDTEQCGSAVKNAVGYQTINKSSANINGLTTEQMTGSNAFNNMIGLEEAYTAPPQQKISKDTGYYYYYYPQLKIFIDDASDMDEYPRIEIYEPKDNTPAEPVEDDDQSTIVPEGYIPVSTVEDLKAIDKNKKSRGKNYYLTNDIDMSDVENFDPIGTEDHDFHGNFDGGGHVIYNLNVDTGKGDYSGLFGCVGSGGTVKNLGVKGTVTGDNYVGGLVGWLSDYATLENCYFIGDVKGNENVGGLVGQSGDKGIWSGGSSKITKSYHIGDIKGKENVGGIAGKVVLAGSKNKAGCARVSYCYSIGNFIQQDMVNCGNIIGYILSNRAGLNYRFENSYYTNKDFNSVGKEKGRGDDGFIKEKVECVDAKNFSTPWTVETYGLSGYTSPPQQISADCECYYYPQLTCFVTDKNDPSQFPTSKKSTYEEKELQNLKTSQVSATTVSEGYIKVSTVEDLKAIDKNEESRGKKYYLTNDIDMSDVENFDPIGTEDHDFHGNFDGGGHVIYNLNVDTGKGDYSGLFGCVGSGGTVKNLGVKGTVKGDNYVGGLVGWLSDYATLENCYFIGDVKGNSYIGGLVGQSGDQGIWSGGSSDIINCYNIGKIEGNEYVGGIVGFLLITRDAPKVENCYHTGTINCLEVKCKAVGGLVGYFAVAHYFGAPDEEKILKNSYYDKDTSNIEKAIGEVNFKSSIIEGDHDEWSFKGLTTDEMTGSDALNYMTNLKDDYTAAPNDDGYPQLNIFVTDANDPSQFPTIAMA